MHDYRLESEDRREKGREKIKQENGMNKGRIKQEIKERRGVPDSRWDRSNYMDELE